MSSHSSHSPWGMVVGAVASGVATALIPPARLPVRARRSIHLGLGLAAGAGVVWVLGRPDQPVGEPDREPLPLRARVAIATALGALVAGTSAGGMALDGAAERALVRRGSRHPRLWIGVAATGLSVAMSVAEDRGRRLGPDEGQGT